MMTVVASSRLRPILHFGIALLAVSPIAAAFYQELGALSRNARLFAAAFAVTISAIAVQLMMMHLRRLGAARLALVLVITLIGILLGVSAGIQFPSADYARISYSDGTYTDHQGPTDLAVWGKSVKGYSLHPAFSSVRVPNGLTAEFASAPNQLTLLFSKPQEALLNKDGTPTPSDGVSLEVKAFDANGQLLQTQKYDIPEKEFLEDRWVTRTILSSSGISKAQVSVFTGPPGSTPDFDSTNVAFEVRDLGTYALFFGKMLLVASGFFVGSLLLVLHFRRQSGTTVDASGQSLVRRAIPYLSVLFLVSLIAYWSMSRSTFIYFWDYRNYWQKTEALYELMAAGAWTQAIGLFANFYAADYSLWPAVLPALLSLITGYPTSLKFAMISTVIYAVPAYIMVAWLGARLLEGDAREQTHRGGSAWVFASLLVFFAFPMFFVTSLYLYARYRRSGPVRGGPAPGQRRRARNCQES